MTTKRSLINCAKCDGTGIRITGDAFDYRGCSDCNPEVPDKPASGFDKFLSLMFHSAIAVTAAMAILLGRMLLHDGELRFKREKPCTEWTYYHADSKVAAFKTAEPPTLMPNAHDMRAECTARAP